MPLIRVTSFDGTVIFEGEGDIQMGVDPSLPDPVTSMVVAMREGNYRAQADLTGLLRTVPHELRYEVEPPDVIDWSPDAFAVCLPEPRVARTVLRIDVPQSFALSMRQELYAGHPDRQGGHGSPFDRMIPGERVTSADQGSTFTAEMARASMNRVRENHLARYGVPSPVPSFFEQVMDRRYRDPRLAAQPIDETMRGWYLYGADMAGPSFAEAVALYNEMTTPEALREILGFNETAPPAPDYDELIASTRAEFPYDPHHYDHPETNEMAWSPPEDGGKVPRCP